jgi:hypothetical protein
MNDTAVTKRYLVASDFDQTLSFNDSGIVLSQVVGVPGFHEKVVGLSKANLVQQGAELAYLLRHDPEFRGVRREHLRGCLKSPDSVIFHRLCFPFQLPNSWGEPWSA